VAIERLSPPAEAGGQARWSREIEFFKVDDESESSRRPITSIALTRDSGRGDRHGALGVAAAMIHADAHESKRCTSFNAGVGVATEAMRAEHHSHFVFKLAERLRWAWRCPSARMKNVVTITGAMRQRRVRKGFRTVT
jgi:hypothetical protein